MKSHQPENYFSGLQLMLAQSIVRIDIDEIDALLMKVDLNRSGKSNMTLLYFAFLYASDEIENRLNIISKLIQHGADPLYQIDDSGCVATICISNADTCYIKALLDGGMDPNIKYADSPLLFYTPTNNQTEHIKLMCSYGANLNLPNVLGFTLLECSLKTYHFYFTNLLLTLGAQFNSVNIRNKNLLQELELLIIQHQNNNERIEQNLLQIRDKLISMGVSWPPPPAPWDKKP